MRQQSIEIIKSSGNVFADLGFANAEERLAKAKLASHINDIIESKKLTQTRAAQILGINQPKVSALVHGQLSGFSMERLIGFLNKLDQDVQIVVLQKPRTRKTPACLRVAFG